MAAPRNRTLSVPPEESAHYASKLASLRAPVPLAAITNSIICQDMLKAAAFLPAQSVDLLFLDPPYNLTKTFHQRTFRKTSADSYSDQLERWLVPLLPALKPTATVYICGDWLSSTSIYDVASRYFTIRNRITWEREKGRGAKQNWKNCSEDVWFCTVSETYYFNAEAVKLRRSVLAPYRDDSGKPKDWQESDGGNVRLTYPSNLWTDLTIPFWSMPENTEHPTQKPEKMLAKLLLASSKPDDVILDPFVGSGTTAVVAKKLGRRFIGIERDKKYAVLAQKRLALAEENLDIQGYRGGVFWERNSLARQKQYT